MTDSIIPDVPVFADAISPLKRAELGLQDELSVFEIGLLTYPDKDADKALRVAEKAKTGCLVTNSMKTEIILSPNIG